MKALDKILDLIAPLRCVICSEEGAILCDSCLLTELIKLPSSCFLCHKVTVNYKTCDNCAKQIPLKAVWSVTTYSSLVSSIITAYKYDSTKSVSSFLAEQMLEILPRQKFVVTNVPTASSRVRDRGFDHCALLAKQIAHQRGLVYSPLLLRTNSSHQVGATRAVRLRQTKDLFNVKNTNLINLQKILLIDDVATTGASLINAARALKKAGATEVYGLIFARKM